MTPEEKQLLLKDLCARLPYEVIVDNPYPAGGAWDTVISIDICAKTVTLLYNGHVFNIDDIRPYLRHMSSMTEKEIDKYRSFIENCYNDYDGSSEECIPISHLLDFFNWAHSRHLDVNHLIEKGLALEAPEGMYKSS